MIADGHEVADADLIDTCRRQLARYKVPKVFVRQPVIMRSPVGKADYRWAARIAVTG